MSPSTVAFWQGCINQLTEEVQSEATQLLHIEHRYVLKGKGHIGGNQYFIVEKIKVQLAHWL